MGSFLCCLKPYKLGYGSMALWLYNVVSCCIMLYIHSLELHFLENARFVWLWLNNSGRTKTTNHGSSSFSPVKPAIVQSILVDFSTCEEVLLLEKSCRSNGQSHGCARRFGKNLLNIKDIYLFMYILYYVILCYIILYYTILYYI